MKYWNRNLNTILRFNTPENTSPTLTIFHGYIAKRQGCEHAISRDAEPTSSSPQIHQIEPDFLPPQLKLQNNQT